MDQFDNIEKELLDFINEFKKRIRESSETKLHLKGWKIFYSPKKLNPDILFIGINPGAGELNNPFEYDHYEHELLHYIDDENNNYGLARNTKALFANKNLMNLLEKSSVKINSRFYATKDVESMLAFEAILETEHNDLYQKLMYLNAKWLKEIILIVNPKVIICEGLKSFTYLDEVIYANEIDWTYELEYEKNKICGYFRRADNLILFGYSRNPQSFDIAHISKYLKPLLIS